MSEIEDRLLQLEELIKIQSNEGNWNYSPYMHGLLIGLLVAKTVFDDTDPYYPDAPEQWLEDINLLEKFNESGAVVK